MEVDEPHGLTTENVSRLPRIPSGRTIAAWMYSIVKSRASQGYTPPPFNPFETSDLTQPLVPSGQHADMRHSAPPTQEDELTAPYALFERAVSSVPRDGSDGRRSLALQARSWHFDPTAAADLTHGPDEMAQFSNQATGRLGASTRYSGGITRRSHPGRRPKEKTSTYKDPDERTPRPRPASLEKTTQQVPKRSRKARNQSPEPFRPANVNFGPTGRLTLPPNLRPEILNPRYTLVAGPSTITPESPAAGSNGNSGPARTTSRYFERPGGPKRRLVDDPVPHFQGRRGQTPSPPRLPAPTYRLGSTARRRAAHPYQRPSSQNRTMEADHTRAPTPPDSRERSEGNVTPERRMAPSPEPKRMLPSPGITGSSPWPSDPASDEADSQRVPIDQPGQPIASGSRTPMQINQPIDHSTLGGDGPPALQEAVTAAESLAPTPLQAAPAPLLRPESPLPYRPYVPRHDYGTETTPRPDLPDLVPDVPDYLAQPVASFPYDCHRNIPQPWISTTSPFQPPNFALPLPTRIPVMIGGPAPSLPNGRDLLLSSSRPPPVGTRELMSHYPMTLDPRQLHSSTTAIGPWQTSVTSDGRSEAHPNLAPYTVPPRFLQNPPDRALVQGNPITAPSITPNQRTPPVPDRVSATHVDHHRLWLRLIDQRRAQGPRSSEDESYPLPHMVDTVPSRPPPRTLVAATPQRRVNEEYPLDPFAPQLYLTPQRPRQGGTHRRRTLSEEAFPIHVTVGSTQSRQQSWPGGQVTPQVPDPVQHFSYATSPAGEIPGINVFIPGRDIRGACIGM